MVTIPFVGIVVVSLETKGRGVWVHERRGFGPTGSGDKEKSVTRVLRSPGGETLLLVENGPDVPSLEEEGEKPSTVPEEGESLPETGGVTVEGRGGDTVAVLVSRDPPRPPSVDPPSETGEITGRPRLRG